AALRLDREHQAGADSGAVDDHGAGAAHAVLAADVGAGQPQRVTQAVGEAGARLEIDLDRLAIDGEGERHQTSPLCAAARNARSTRVVTNARRYSASACKSRGGS